MLSMKTHYKAQITEISVESINKINEKKLARFSFP